MSEHSTEKDATCEAIEAVFVWGPQRCMARATGTAVDPTWGTEHAVCAEHLASSTPPEKTGASDE